MTRLRARIPSLLQGAVSLSLVLALATHSAVAHADELDTFFEEFTAEWVRTNPDLATSSRYFSGAEQDRLERQLTPFTRAYRLERVKLAERGVRGLKRFDLTKVSPTQRVSAELMRWQLQIAIDDGNYADFFFPLEQFQGANVRLVETLTVRHPMVERTDADRYLDRLRLVSFRMDEAVAEAKRLIDAKKLPPRFIIQSTLASMQTFVAAPPETNPFVQVFAQKLAASSEVLPQDRATLTATAVNIVRSQIYPAWGRAIAVLESILPSSNDHAGLWRFSGGSAAYAHTLARYTTTKLTADQIHSIGLREVARIESEMDTILRSIGRTDGSIGERMKKLGADLRYPDWASDASRAQIMKDIDAMIADAIARSAPMFERAPVTRVIAQPFPQFREASAAANYNSAPRDGSRPAVFQIPLREGRMTRLGLRTLIYHETVPGHHFQIALEAENPSVPRFRQSRAFGGISALSEGWALYAERIAAESGWYEGDSEGRLGQLNAELFRARRLVVDTGLHAKRWTRQQAIDYSIEASEVERYVVNPGQACSYMIGQLKFIELRDRARAKLKDRFSFKEFHRVVLDTGTVPLDMLEREVDRYIREKS